MRRWLHDALTEQRYGPRPHTGFTFTPDLRVRLTYHRGDAAALHRELAAAPGGVLPSLRTVQRAARAQIARAVLSSLPHPVHAAALALVLITGIAIEELRGPTLSAILPQAAAVRIDGLYAIPACMRPAVHAAYLYRRLSGALENQRLLLGATDGSLGRIMAAALEECAPASRAPGPLAARSWHARAECWFVAEPLHAARCVEPDLGQAR